MRIKLDDQNPIESYPYLEVGAKQLNNGKPIILSKALPIYLGEFENAKSTVDFLIICSDLQGAIEKDGQYKLIGESIPEFLKLLLLSAGRSTPGGVNKRFVFCIIFFFAFRLVVS